MNGERDILHMVSSSNCISVEVKRRKRFAIAKIPVAAVLLLCSGYDVLSKESMKKQREKLKNVFNIYLKLNLL